ncbi:hypothetical protein BJX70DRAFT_396130 [Aspergillus crustosus]
MGLSSLSGWWYAMVTTVSSTWTFIQSYLAFNRGDRTGRSECRGTRALGIIDWVFLAWDVCGPLVWWWISFALFIVNPQPEPSISLVGWATAWKLSHTLQYHPYSCIFTLSTTATSVADQIPSNPGTSSCSAPEFCSKTWLFSTLPFAKPGDKAKRAPSTIFGIFVAAFATLTMGCTLAAIGNGGRAWWSYFTRYYRMMAPTTSVGYLAIVRILVFSIFEPIALSEAWNRRHRDALVAYDYDCRVVHVAVSEWRFYLDVSTDARPLRVAKMWFGV